MRKDKENLARGYKRLQIKEKTDNVTELPEEVVPLYTLTECMKRPAVARACRHPELLISFTSAILVGV